MLQIAQGKTSPQTNQNDWNNYLNDNDPIAGIRIDVDTSECKFTTTPHYLVSMEGDKGWQWHLNGLNCIYNVSPTGFSVYLRWTDEPTSSIPPGSTNEPNPLRVSTAIDKGWTLRWTAIQTCPCTRKKEDNPRG
ncbi:MAG: hypothetical protein GYB31_03895 [Bacteroidetes bacterium]|nr:hypothetical protein [Bacteroidota bacterium]